MTRSLVVVLLLLCFLMPVNGSYILTSNGTFGPPVSSANTGTAYQLIQYHLPQGSTYPISIATNAAGDVWFTEQSSNQIGMFDPTSDHFTEYNIPTPNSNPLGIIVDRAGNVWFTELSSNKLGEIRAGQDQITEYSIPNGTIPSIAGQKTTSCGPDAVVSDTSGNVWLSCLFSNQIDEFVPSNGKFQSFQVPVFESSVADMVFTNNDSMWFTAANVGMLGEVTISQLRNGTSDGIREFAPTNSTYLLNDTYPASLGGPSVHGVSSLPTPSGIVFDSKTDTLWITEHVDTSFDSYNIRTGSLDRYWTSQTLNNYGYPVSLPNGIVLDSNGNVWIAEHYGNKIAEFVPSTKELVEYPIPCCSANIASPYEIATGTNGTIWFVEITANSIGELKPVSAMQSFEISIPNSVVDLNHGVATIPITLSLKGGNETSVNVAMSISGISSTGSLKNASASFTQQQFKISTNQSSISTLQINDQGLHPGIYDLTVSANLTDRQIIYSRIVALRVSPPTNFFSSIGITPNSLEYLGIGAVVIAVVAIMVNMSFRRVRKHRR